ncbi:VWA domain-containing protein [Nocardiopsis sp. RV163]|uniref:VWA domain-containing protein n=1 Tax=Nocardiopsis sp. RV163 TaxID=1661388 RepID=UPI00064BADB2|nr:VWA domain-containing protein [Nocardiopsis sp. RV163]
MRFRYRAYMGGPDPLADPDPPPEEAVAAARELMALVAPALETGSAPGSEGPEAGSATGPEALAEEDRRALSALDEALSRYADGDRSALGEVDTTALGRLLDRVLGRETGEALARLDGADHGLSPRELRRLGEVALREAETYRRGRGGLGGAHRGGTAPGGEPTGPSLPSDEDGDRPLDAVATVREAALRRARPEERGVALRAEDVRVAGAEPSEAAAVSLLVDLSHSMVTRSLHEAATRTALALHTLVSTRRPQDRLHLVGFGERARELSPASLVAHDWRRVPGTNLHHALRLARAHLRRHGGLRPQVLVVTDGEPTAHLGEDGDARFSWPPAPRTVELTFAELDAVLRGGAEVTFFLLADDPRLRAFQDLLERRRGVRVVHAGAEALGPLVVDRYLGHRDARRPG